MRTLFGIDLARVTSVNGIRLWPGTLSIIAEEIGKESMLQADIYDGPDMHRLRADGDAQARKPERLLMLASRASSISFEQK